MCVCVCVCVCVCRQDLERADAPRCEAIFILCDKYTTEPEVPLRTDDDKDDDDDDDDDDEDDNDIYNDNKILISIRNMIGTREERESD